MKKNLIGKKFIEEFPRNLIEDTCAAGGPTYFGVTDDQALSYIDRLDGLYRTIILMRYQNHMTVPEIANALEMEQKTVYSKLNTGKRYFLNKCFYGRYNKGR